MYDSGCWVNNNYLKMNEISVYRKTLYEYKALT